jgi:hypothetical protein
MVDNLDNLLVEPKEIKPSSHFAARVMGEVRIHASTPPPLSFPWKRVLPGLTAVSVAVGILGMQIVRSGSAGTADSFWLPSAYTFGVLLNIVSRYQVNWIALALFLTFGSFSLSVALGPNLVRFTRVTRNKQGSGT